MIPSDRASRPFSPDVDDSDDAGRLYFEDGTPSYLARDVAALIAALESIRERVAAHRTSDESTVFDSIDIDARAAIARAKGGAS